MKMSGKTAVSAVSALALTSMGMAALPAMAVAAPDATAPTVAAEAVAAAEGTQARPVQGTFSFTQDTVSGNDYIRDTFVKAATAVCASMPEYQAEGSIEVTGCGYCFTATAEDFAAGEDNAAPRIMGCACASNGAGGGAMASAEVSGATVASIAAMFGAFAS